MTKPAVDPAVRTEAAGQWCVLKKTEILLDLHVNMCVPVIYILLCLLIFIRKILFLDFTFF